MHPGDENAWHALFLVTDDLDLEMRTLREAGAPFGEVTEQLWGPMVRIELPGGGTLGIHEPPHPRSWRADLNPDGAAHWHLRSCPPTGTEAR